MGVKIIPQLKLKSRAVKLQSEASMEQVLAPMSLDSQGYGRIAILGDSGAGKSTLLNLICGILPSGDATVSLTNSEDFKTKFGLVPQRRELFDWLNVEQNIVLGTSGRKDLRKLVPKTMKRLKLDRLSNRMPIKLSGGELARVAIARALIAEPAVLLLDEPFTGLDSSARWEILHLIIELQEEFGFLGILVSHDLSEISAFAEKVFLLHGRPAELDPLEQDEFQKILRDQRMILGLNPSEDGEMLEHGQKRWD